MAIFDPKQYAERTALLLLTSCRSFSFLELSLPTSVIPDRSQGI
jgi:hypothetical protein